MENRDKSEQLLDLLLDLTDGNVKAYQFAELVSCELDETKARTTETTPFAWATFDGEGSYDLRLYECNESYRDEWLAANGPRYADWVIPLYEAPDEQQARIAELEQANSRAILDSSDHVGDATKMVTDRQLADAVNELRDIAIKYHAADQLRERIAGVVHGLVRGEPVAVAVDAGALDEALENDD